MATSLEGFSGTSHEKWVLEDPFKGAKRVQAVTSGTPPVLKVKVVMPKVVLVISWVEKPRSVNPHYVKGLGGALDLGAYKQ